VSGIYGSQRILNGKPRRPHNGVDVVAPRGTPVVACADGVVALVNPGMFFTGKTVMIDHGHGLTSVYVHMDDIRVRAGDRVRKGARIGSIGMTGRATGPHLHWGVSLFNTHLDPALLAGPMAAGGAERRP
jgi:murein DD-endopeptidase MepM/ murein hydrolase activator NlpD